jgi:FtsH-binding integral membrane protein
MQYKQYLLGGLVYVIIAILLGMIGNFVPMLGFIAPFAVLIAALIAGIYIGRKALKPFNAAIDGIIVGVIGGVIGGIVNIFVPLLISPSTGISYLNLVISFLGDMLTPYESFWEQSADS